MVRIRASRRAAGSPAAQPMPEEAVDRRTERDDELLERYGASELSATHQLDVEPLSRGPG
jgi:hypothetical protein